MPWLSRTVEIANPTAYPEKGDLCWKAIKRLPTAFRASRPHTRDGAELLNPHFHYLPRSRIGVGFRRQVLGKATFKVVIALGQGMIGTPRRS